jgi:hypothetical protein
MVISFWVIIVCLSINIVNHVDVLYFGETGKPLFGWTAGDTPVNTNTLDEYHPDNINNTMGIYTVPGEQPEGLVNAGFIDDLQKKFSILDLIIKTVLYSSVGFYKFAAHLGRPDSGLTFIPTYIGLPLTVLICINHVLGIMQYVRGFNIKNAG